MKLSRDPELEKLLDCARLIEAKGVEVDSLHEFVAARRKESARTDQANYVQEVREDLSENASCHVCGAAMVALGICDRLKLRHEFQDGTRFYGKCRNWRAEMWLCRSCGTTTGCS